MPMQRWRTRGVATYTVGWCHWAIRRESELLIKLSGRDRFLEHGNSQGPWTITGVRSKKSFQAKGRSSVTRGPQGHVRGSSREECPRRPTTKGIELKLIKANCVGLRLVLG